MWEEPGGRTLVPGDMDGESAAAVRQLGLAANDGELRARLLDISWECLRDPEAAREAVKGYLEAADALFDPEHWTEYAARVERAARLARQLGDRKLVDEVLGEIESRVIELDGADPLFLSCRLMELLQEFDRGDPASMRDIAAKGARLAEGRGDFERERTYHDLVGGWSRRAGDDEGERGARIGVAASLRGRANSARVAAKSWWLRIGWKRRTRPTGTFQACARRRTKFTPSCARARGGPQELWVELLPRFRTRPS